MDKIFISEKFGDDLTGDGSEIRPLKTALKALQIIENVQPQPVSFLGIFLEMLQHFKDLSKLFENIYAKLKKLHLITRKISSKIKIDFNYLKIFR